MLQHPLYPTLLRGQTLNDPRRPRTDTKCTKGQSATAPEAPLPIDKKHC